MSLAARLNRLGLSVYAPRFEEEGLLELADLEFCFREDFVDMGLTLDQATQLLDGFPGRYLLRPDLPHRASQLPVYRSGLHLPPEPEVKEEGDRSDAQASEDHECPKPQACKVEEVLGLLLRRCSGGTSLIVSSVRRSGMFWFPSLAIPCALICGIVLLPAILGIMGVERSMCMLRFCATLTFLMSV